MSSLGGRLREERKRLDMTQAEFGKIGGVSGETQGNYEKGKRTPTATYLAAIT